MQKMTKHLSALLFLTLGCGIASAQVARPNAVWFNRVISTERSRQVYVGLNANMWVMYDLPQAVLFQAWQGGTSGGAYISGAPYSSMGGATGQYWFLSSAPQFPHVWKTSGTSYFKDSVAEYFASYTNPAHISASTYYQPTGKWPQQPISSAWGGPYSAWTVRNGSGTNLNAAIRFRGYTVPGNVFTLKFGLILPDNGGEISVSESPEYSNLPSGNHLVRTLTFSGIPANYQVRLEKLGGPNASAWSVTSGSASIQSGALVQTANGTTILNGSF